MKKKVGRPVFHWLWTGAVLLLWGSLSLVSVVHGQAASLAGAEGERLNIPLTDARIEVDGCLDELFWKDALFMELKYEVEPGENTPAPVKTEFLIIHSRTHLYAAFRCYDPNPSAIRAHISDRDKDMGDDFVAVALDTFNDERNNYILWANPHGVQEDAIMSDSGYQIDWDALYETQGHIYPWGYSVEFSIPFSSLRFQRSQNGQMWGIDAWRNYPRDKYHVMGLFPRDRANNCYQCQMIKIWGFQAARPGRNFELAPAVVGTVNDSRPDWPDGEIKNDSKKMTAGLTGKWGVTPNLTLNGAVNPDFSQVEADARQVDINAPFALFYNEKRPFFTEGIDFFNSPLNVIYTRNMRDPNWGIKLTGKEGTHSIGAFLARDEVTRFIIPGVMQSRSAGLESGSGNVAIRYRNDFGSIFTVGALLTHRDAGDYRNQVFGADSHFRITKSDDLTLQYLGSFTRYPSAVAQEYEQPQGSFTGRAFSASYVRSTRTYNINAQYSDISGDFRADLGFIPRVGQKDWVVEVDYRWNAQPGRWWSQFVLYTGGFLTTGHEDNRLLRRGLLGSVIFRGFLNSKISLTFKSERENYQERFFNMSRWQLNVALTPVGGLTFWLYANQGDMIDYENIRPGKRTWVNGVLQWSVGPRLHFIFDQTWERMNVNNQKLYIASISQSSIVYQFNTRTMARAIVQYVSYNQNPSNYLFEVSEQTKNLFLQFLFSYKLNPRTVLFLGYADNFDGEEDIPLIRSNRALFLKIGYAWQL